MIKIVVLLVLGFGKVRTEA